MMTIILNLFPTDYNSDISLFCLTYMNAGFAGLHSVVGRCYTANATNRYLKLLNYPKLHTCNSTFEF